MNNRIVIGSESIQQDLGNILEELQTLRTDRTFAKIMGNDNLQKIRDYETAVRRRLKETFNMVVIGDFKRGKSTLVNALLGKNLLPTAVTPETVTINRISYGETPRMEAVLRDGKRARIDKGELKREQLEKIIAELPSPVEYIDVREAADVLKEISIVDTPGVGDLLKEFDDRVADYLVNADAVIFVISARSPLSQTEQTFMSTAVIPQSFSRIFVVINMADSLETVENIEKITKLIKERTHNISDNIYVYALSALDELCRKEGLDRPEPDLTDYLAENFLNFESAVRKDIIEQKDIIKCSRAVTLTDTMLKDTAGRIKLIQDSLQLNIEALLAKEQEYQGENSELLQNIEAHKQHLLEDIENMKLESRDWIVAYMERIRQELIMLQRTNVPTADLSRHLQFFLMDLTKQGILMCVDGHQEEISNRIGDVAQNFAGTVARSTFGNVDANISGSIRDVTWTGADSLMFVGETLQLSKVLGPIYLIGQVIAGFVRQKTVENRHVDYIQPILASFDSIINDVCIKVFNVYDELKRTCLLMIDELYREQLATSLSAIQQAKEVVLCEDLKSDEVSAQLDEVLQTIQTMHERLSSYK